MKIDLQKIRVFSRLSPQALAAVEKCIQVRTHERGSIFLWEADECESVYFIQSGLVEIYRLAPSGREQVLEHLSKGEAFNLVPVFISDSSNQANARAATDVRLLVIGKREFLDLLDRYPEILRAITAYFAYLLQRMVALVERLSLFSVRQRLAEFLIKQADQDSTDSHPRWTQDDIARQLGTVRDVVGRTLRKFEDEGLIRFQRQRILLLNRQKLQMVANGEE
jgi:CRP/FNR family cyclic AMP-dependent transcriptional regulator